MFLKALASYERGDVYPGYSTSNICLSKKPPCPLQKLRGKPQKSCKDAAESGAAMFFMRLERLRCTLHETLSPASRTVILTIFFHYHSSP